MEEREKEGFVVRDRRRLDAEGNIRPGVEAPARPKPAPKPAEPPRKEEAKPPPTAERNLFVNFIAQLAHMAYAAMGLVEGSRGVNLQEAQYIIDSLGMLKEKTKGNLSPEEERALEGILYELKMNYVRVAGL